EEAPVTIATRSVRAKRSSAFTRTSSVMVLLQPKVAADDELHDLVGPRPDPGHAGVCPGSGGVALAHEPVPAVQLNAGIQDLSLHVGGPPLRLGGIDGRQLAAGVSGDLLVHVGLGDLGAGHHVGQQEGIVLEAADRAPERLALTDVAEGLLEYEA